MNKYAKYGIAFLCGALSYQLMLILLFGTVEFGSELDNHKYSGVGEYALESALFKNGLNNVCEYLEGKKCSCMPIIKTDLACESLFDEYLEAGVRKKFEE